MKRIVSALKKEKSYRDFWKAYTERKGKRFPILVSGLSEGATAAFYTALVSDLATKKKAVPALCILPSEKECARLAAMLHDVGKMDIPLGVMDKSTKLGKQEKEFIKKITRLSPCEFSPSNNRWELHIRHLDVDMRNLRFLLKP